MHLFSAILTLLLWAGQVLAQPAFDRAVALWLDGNDRDSLPALAKLAADGDEQARLLLAQIETRDLGPSPFRSSLSPAQSRTLFRAPSGSKLFSSGWLVVAARAGSKRASALLAARESTPNPDLIKRLAALGEAQASDHPTRILALYGTQAQRNALMNSADLLPELRPYLTYLSGPSEPRGDGLAALRHIAPDKALDIHSGDLETLDMAGILALGYPYGDMHPANRWRETVENWVMTAPETQPVADLCRANCQGDLRAAECGFAMLAFTGGYYEVIRTDSPLESAISQERFLDSKRARLMALRRVVLVRRETNLDWLAGYDELRSVSVCLAEMVRNERKLYEESQ